MKLILLISSFMPLLILSDMNSWECSKFEGSKIVAEDGTELGEIGPSWKTDSIFNDSSEYSSSWSSESIFNSHSDYGNSYSNESVFNDSASSPPKIISEEGEEIGKLSIGPGGLGIGSSSSPPEPPSSVIMSISIGPNGND